jgi:phosphatidylglycerophosphatase C
VTPETARRVAIFDLDGTLSRRDTFLPFIAGLLTRRPDRWLRLPLLLGPVALFLLRQMDRGGLKGQILHILFGGLPEPAIATWARQFSAAAVQRLMFTDSLHVLRGHQQAGDHVVLLSASPDLYVPDIGRELGANEVFCTPIAWRGNLLDGRLAGPNHRDEQKLRVLQALRQRLPGLQVIAYGNSEADLPHLLQCEQAVYVNAPPRLAATLTARGLQCVQWR